MHPPLRPKNIVIATIGSLGDLHPCLALAHELASRGCRVTIATTPYYKTKVEECGFSFHLLRPAWDPTDARLIRACEDPRRGLEVLYRQLVLPELQDTYDDLLAASENADLLIAGELVYAAPLVAEKKGLPWVSLILSPMSFFSSIDPSFTANLPALIHVRKAGPTAYKLALNLGKLATRHWSNPVRRLRREQGLRPKCDPIFKDKFSPHLVLALFSQWFAPKRPDSPEQTLQTGFLNVRSSPDPDMLARLDRFLSAGSAPVVFTQGSAAVHNPGDFYNISAAAAKRLRLRAMLVGTTASHDDDAGDILAMPYVPYSHVFPKASVIVHQGGSGTIGEALHAGRPMLVVPYAWDQPDNARRIERLGVGLHLPRNRYTVETATAAIGRLLESPAFAAAGAALASRMRTEDARVSACEAILSLLKNAGRTIGAA